ncbi:MAG TPA: phosphatidylinositol mannoside acyltransferase [Acidimicrobiales bacterium]|nr:phosphatidylinositol mannoside acyltransferase [Acidimicrobiales bacterium]
MSDASEVPDTDSGTEPTEGYSPPDGGGQPDGPLGPGNDGAEVGAWLAYFMYRALGTAMQKLPEVVAAAAASVVASVLSVFSAKARAMYGRHLRRVLGPDLSDAELRATTRRAFLNYGRYWFEGARLPALGRDVIEDRFMVESGWEHLVSGMEAGNGVIMALPHIGSWEWGGAWLALQGYPMTSVAEPLKPPAMYDWFVSQREAMGLSIVPLGADASRVLLRTLRAGKLVGLLCDRDIVGNGIDVEFFGERTTMPAGPAMLALRTGALVLPTAVYSGPGLLHSAVIMAPVDAQRRGGLRQDVARVTQLIADDLELLIRRAPEQWHLFQPNWPSDAAPGSSG